MPDSYAKGRGRHKKDCDCIRCSKKRAEKIEQESKTEEATKNGLISQ
jgi:hypothetical protein